MRSAIILASRTRTWLASKLPWRTEKTRVRSTWGHGCRYPLQSSREPAKVAPNFGATGGQRDSTIAGRDRPRQGNELHEAADGSSDRGACPGAKPGSLL